MMRRISPMVMVAAAWATAAQAAEWRYVGASDGGSIIYIDKSSIVRSGDTAKAWFKHDLSANKSETDRTILVQHIYHCAAREFGTVAITRYDPSGKITYNENQPEYRVTFSPVVPDSVGEGNMTAACEQVRPSQF